MPSYDASRFDPPAPVAHVTLRDPQTSKTVSNVALLLDTGSDVTLLPRAIVEQLGVSPLRDQGYELMGFDGTRSTASIVILDMIFLRRVFRGRYLLIDTERGILGRDILNHVSMVLNGPQQEWSESPS